jgi:hypothetical protein
MRRVPTSQGEYSRRVQGVGIAAGSIPLEQWQEASYESPVTQGNNIEGQVLVPMAQSAVTATAVGLLSVGALVAVGLDWQQVLTGGLAVFGVVFTGQWLYLMTDTRRMLWQVERLINRDLDGDGETGKPGKTLNINVSSTENKNMHMDRLHLEGINPDDFVTFAQAVLNGQSMAVNRWTGSAWVWSRSQYDMIMSELERATLVRFVNGQQSQGRELTSKGKITFQWIINDANSN